MKPPRAGVISLLLILVAAAISLLLARSLPVRLLDLRSYDAWMRWHPPAPAADQVVMVIVDDATRRAIPDPLVMWDGYYAEVLRAAQRGGARSIAVDTIFALPDDKAPPGSTQLSQAVLEVSAAGSPVILGVDSSSATPDSSLYTVAVATGAIGSLNLAADEDEAIRRIALCSRGSGQTVFSLGVQAAAAARNSSAQCDPPSLETAKFLAGADGNTLIAFTGPPYTIPHVSFAEVLRLARANDTASLQHLFSGKVVLIGTDDIQDRHATPLGKGRNRHPGVEIHANVAQMVLDGTSLRAADGRSTIWLIAIAAMLSCLLALRLGWMSAALAAAFIAVSFVGGAAVAWQQRLWIPIVGPIAAVLIGYVTATLYRYQTEVRATRELRRHFRQYVPDAVIEQLLASGALGLEGKRVPVAVMFSDIRSFTTMTEAAVPEQLVAQLNEYLSAMTEVITDHHGIVDKFIGDGILSVFGAPLAHAENAWNAVRASQMMLAQLHDLNARWASAGRERFEIGIGIHFGEVIVGDIGSERKKEYTVIGDTVNTAARLESQTKDAIEQHGVRVLISAAVLAELESTGHRVDAELMGEQMLKGKKQATAVYLLRGLEAKTAADPPQSMVAR